MKRVYFIVLLGVVGCGTDYFAPFITAPTEKDIVIGGIADLHPFIGRVQCNDNASSDMGLFMLASCGCGDWRVLVQPNNGAKQFQFPILFYSDGDYATSGEVAVYAVDGQEGFSGRVDQDAGTVGGRVQNGFFRGFTSAARGDAHAQPVDACILCHLGDDPVFPLPDTHPQAYKTNPRICLDCHSANGQ